MAPAQAGDANGVANGEGAAGLAGEGDGANGDGAAGAAVPAAARYSSWSMVNTRV